MFNCSSVSIAVLHRCCRINDLKSAYCNINNVIYLVEAVVSVGDFESTSVAGTSSGSSVF